MNQNLDAPGAVRGQNVLKDTRRKTLPECFLEQLNDPLIFILFVAAAISMLLGEVSDTAIILAVILVNALVGVIQEGRAQKALDALKQLTSPAALVRRGGRQVEIPARDLIPGDIVCLDAGRQVPADLELISVNSLKIEESALTGESVPVEKDLGKHNRAYMSTNVTYGRGEGVVTAIGMDTEIGRIARMIGETPAETTPLQKRLADLGKLLSAVSVALCALLFGVAVLQRRDVMEMLITAISLAVAAVPEGLPAVVTMVLALSVSRMVKVNTIVKRLPSVETLGCVSVVCSDKTGTLTQNRMTVTACYLDGQIREASLLDPVRDRRFLEGFALCCDAVIEDGNRLGDPTELALLDLAGRFGLKRAALEADSPRIGEIAFDSERKMMTTLHRSGRGSISYTKGSPDVILRRCDTILSAGRVRSLDSAERRNIEEALRTLSGRALRLLALATRTGDDRPSEERLTFVGLAGMIDPIRPEAVQAVQDFRTAGVKTVMITGDRSDTAFVIARELGIAAKPSDCMSGPQIDALSDREFAAAARSLSVFAQVSPEHKVRIVKALKADGKIVAMTGDGVNDAPSRNRRGEKRRRSDSDRRQFRHHREGHRGRPRHLRKYQKSGPLPALLEFRGNHYHAGRHPAGPGLPAAAQPHPVDQPDYRLPAGPGPGRGPGRPAPLHAPPAPSRERKPLCGRRPWLHAVLRPPHRLCQLRRLPAAAHFPAAGGRTSSDAPQPAASP